MELSPGWVSAGCAAGGLIVTVAGFWIRGAFEARDAQIVAIKATQKILFEKLDATTRELHDYKLHVAETYVAESKLEKFFAPVNARLSEIERELRERARA